MKAISVREPFASQIARKEKRIENRSWGAGVRGEVALHRCGENGAIIGVMNIADVVPATEALQKYPDQTEFIIGPLCWVIESFRPCIPVRRKGRLSLWECPTLLFHETAAAPSLLES